MIALERLGAVTDLARGTRQDGPALARETRRRAALLAGLGLRPGDRVLIAHGGSADFFADLFASWACGAAAACVNPGLTPGELEVLADFLRPALILVEAAVPAPVRGRVVALARERAAAAAEPPSVPPAADAPALVLFTSGTTGSPKGVVHSFGSLASRLALNRRHMEAAALARTLCLLPTHFGHGLIGNCLTPLLAGHELFLQPNPGVGGAAKLGQTIDAHGITFLSSVPSLWKLALRLSPPPGGGSLRRVHVGSAPLSAELWQGIARWAGTRAVLNMYGLTETANWVAGASAGEFEPADGLIGRMWGGEARVRDASGALSAEGEGELVLRTPSLMQGYLDRPELTAAVLRDGWYATGDVGRIDPAGVIRLTGRQKDEINRAGMKVQPAEIDLLLERHPMVAEACCFGLPDAVSGEIVAAAVRPAEGGQLDPAALRAWCRERLHRDAVPERWFVLAELPKNDRGKISRQTVRERCLAAAQQPLREAPATP